MASQFVGQLFLVDLPVPEFFSLRYLILKELLCFLCFVHVLWWIFLYFWCLWNLSIWKHKYLSSVFVVIFFKTIWMYNKRIIRLGFCHIQNIAGNQAQGNPILSTNFIDLVLISNLKFNFHWLTVNYIVYAWIMRISSFVVLFIIVFLLSIQAFVVLTCN